MAELKDIAKDAFKTRDLINGHESGGIEAPSILVDVRELEDGGVAVDWKHPETCGLSDCRYHYLDLSVKTFVYRLFGNMLTLNGSTDIFGTMWVTESKELAEKFYDRWNLAPQIKTA